VKPFRRDITRPTSGLVYNDVIGRGRGRHKSDVTSGSDVIAISCVTVKLVTIRLRTRRALYFHFRFLGALFCFRRVEVTADYLLSRRWRGERQGVGRSDDGSGAVIRAAFRLVFHRTSSSVASAYYTYFRFSAVSCQLHRCNKMPGYRRETARQLRIF